MVFSVPASSVSDLEAQEDPRDAECWAGSLPSCASLVCSRFGDLSRKDIAYSLVNTYYCKWTMVASWIWGDLGRRLEAAIWVNTQFLKIKERDSRIHFIHTDTFTLDQNPLCYFSIFKFCQNQQVCTERPVMHSFLPKRSLLVNVKE